MPGYEIRQTQARFSGAVFELVTDEVTMPDGSTADRDYIRHAGSVAVVAIDDQERVMLVRQYRHADSRGALGAAGRAAGRTRRRTGRRSRARVGRGGRTSSPRGGNRCSRCTRSPGYSNEMIRIFLAQELGPAPPDFQFHAQFEEAELTRHQVPLAEAVAMVYRGEITNGPTALGLLATWHRLRQA